MTKIMLTQLLVNQLPKFSLILFCFSLCLSFFFSSLSNWGLYDKICFFSFSNFLLYYSNFLFLLPHWGHNWNRFRNFAVSITTSGNVLSMWSCPGIVKFKSGRWYKLKIRVPSNWIYKCHSYQGKKTKNISILSSTYEEKMRRSCNF